MARLGIPAQAPAIGPAGRAGGRAAERRSAVFLVFFLCVFFLNFYPKDGFKSFLFFPLRWRWCPGAADEPDLGRPSSVPLTRHPGGNESERGSGGQTGVGGGGIGEGGGGDTLSKYPSLLAH